MGNRKNLLLATAGAVVIAWQIVGAAQVAIAISLTGYYFKVPNTSPKTNPDFQNGIDNKTVKGLVQSTLGPDGLPVVSTAGTSHSGGSGPITDVNSSGEILWWSTTSTHGVTYEKTQNDSDANFSTYGSSFYPGGQSNDSSFFRTVHWSGTLNFASAGSTTFKLGSDDDAFLFVDNQLQVDNGGVKANSPVLTASSNLSAGSHNFDLFFADRNTTGSGITFSITNSAGTGADPNVTLSPRSSKIPFEFSPGLGILVLGAWGAMAQLKSKVQKRKFF